jgi:hypothetical protein
VAKVSPYEKIRSAWDVISVLGVKDAYICTRRNLPVAVYGAVKGFYVKG